MSGWLCSEEIASRLIDARRNAAPEILLKAASYAGRGRPSPLSVAGSTARIDVEGVLTEKPDFFAELFGDGNTTYSDIEAALAAAVKDPRVQTIELHVNSGGGSVAGLFGCLDSIKAARASGKKMLAVCEAAQSAAYAIAAATGRIEARGVSSAFGSIGVAASFYLSDRVVDITSTDAPHKRPDVRTEEGKATVREYLDETSDLFVAAIATGRGVTSEKVRKNYGGGKSFLAETAKAHGMVDHIRSNGASKMNETEAQALRDQVAALTSERDRALEASKETATQLAAVSAQVAVLTSARNAETHAARVDELQRAGKLPPSLRSWALKQSKEVLEAYAADAPAVSAAVSAPVIAPAAAPAAELTAEELKVCEQLGITAEEFKKERAEEQKRAAERRRNARAGSDE
jgi:ClpP class serine protease